MTWSLIPYGTEKYVEMISLRKQILRDPLGLVFTEADLARDRDDLLCGYYDEDNKLIGSCILTRIDENIAQLRQMAISSDYQGKNIGKQLLYFAEKTAIENNYKRIYLHARKTAIGFYLKVGYRTIGEEYIEVGIPHMEMTKELTIS